MIRWFLQRFQERIKRPGREHMHLVDNIDFVARCGRGVAYTVQHFAHILDACTRGRIHFQHIHVRAGHYEFAMFARFRKVCRRAVHCVRFIIQRSGQKAGCCCFPNSANTCHHKGMRDTPRGKGIGQGCDHGILANHIFKGGRAVFARQNLIGLLWGRVHHQEYRDKAEP